MNEKQRARAFDTLDQRSRDFATVSIRRVRFIEEAVAVEWLLLPAKSIGLRHLERKGMRGPAKQSPL